jgi:hypothetical protein
LGNHRLPRGARVAAGAGSVLGFVVGLAAAASLPSRAAAGQVPGYAVEHGFDPRTDVLRLVILAVAPLIGGTAGMHLASRNRPRSAPATPESRSNGRGELPARTGLLLSAVAAHAIAVWTFLVVPLTRTGVPPVLSLAGLMAVSFGLTAVLGSGDSGRGAVFLAAACPILPLTLLGERPPALWLALGVAGLVLPILARSAARALPGIARPLRTLLVWALLPGSVTGLVAAVLLRAPTVADVFEDGHGLLPASEYLRGELPYRDIVPGHGLVTDGLLQTAQLALFGDDYRGLKRGTKVFGALFLPGFYALGYAATGSPAVGFGGLLLTLLLLPNYVFARAMLSIWTLALAIYASRTKKAGAWLACGAALPVGLCVAVDFTAYAVAGVAVALWVARGRRGAHLRKLLVGAAVSAGAIALVLAGFGILGEFARTTFVFLPSLLPAYALGFPPVELHKSGASLAAWLRNQAALIYVFFAISVVVSGALLPRGPRIGARARGLLPVLAWVACAMLSVIERHHVVYPLFPVPVGLLLLHRWVLGWRPWTSARALASGLVVAALALSREPASFVSTAAGAIVHPWTPPGVRAVDGLSRARGALFFPWDASLIEATSQMIRQADLRGGETWLDFANAPGLYYLFDRDCPIRYYEVPFYEAESAQREVIAAVAANPRVRTVLMSSGLLAQTIDGLANDTRAPHVAAFLRERFRPFYRAGGIEFWLRKDEAPVTSKRP